MPVASRMAAAMSGAAGPLASAAEMAFDSS